MAEGLIPFGKYKNQPLDLLAADKPYCDWLLAQGWFVQRYPSIHTLIINHFGEPTDTPAHNRLQLRFLDEILRLQAMRAVSPHGVLSFLGPVAFEVQGADVWWRFDEWRIFDIHNEHRRQWVNSHNSFGIECKPTLGDDYPAVLRYLRGLSVRVDLVVIEDWMSTGGTFEDGQAFFATAGIRLEFLSVIEALPPLCVYEKTALPEVESYEKSCYT